MVAYILAGMGAAWLIAASSRWAPVALAVLLLAAGVSVFGFPIAGIEAPHERWDIKNVGAGPEKIAFFRQLEEKGNRGPIVELPAVPAYFEPRRILLAAYHHRRTSACFGSYLGSARAEVSAIAKRLPSPEAARELRSMGFTTVVLHHPSSPANPAAGRRAEKFARRVEQQERRVLQLVHRTPTMTAYDISPIER